MSDHQEITSTADFDIRDGEPSENMTASAESDADSKIEFHVQMRGYTMTDMERLIVDAAAKMIVGRSADNKLSKLIEERCAAIMTAKVNKHLEGITNEIIDQHLTPNYGDKKPVTMREFIGLCGREYLTEWVDYEGKTTRDHYNKKEPRISYLVGKYAQKNFETEITKATNAAIVEIQKSVRVRHEEILTAEKKRLADALGKLTGAA